MNDKINYFYWLDLAKRITKRINTDYNTTFEVGEIIKALNNLPDRIVESNDDIIYNAVCKWLSI